jgi:hypothetical protein
MAAAVCGRRKSLDLIVGRLKNTIIHVPTKKFLRINSNRKKKGTVRSIPLDQKCGKPQLEILDQKWDCKPPHKYLTDLTETSNCGEFYLHGNIVNQGSFAAQEVYARRKGRC